MVCGVRGREKMGKLFFLLFGFIFIRVGGFDVGCGDARVDLMLNFYSQQRHERSNE